MELVSSSSRGVNPLLWTYHVFLSFRGEDTRRGFTDHLCASLERKGITTFKDDKDLEKGQAISKELLKAIEESMFAIIILSPNYASSTWCLDEIQKIVECRNNQALELMPVFYGVDPSDVRRQRGSLEEAFKNHEENFGQDSEKVKKWRHALTQASSYSGWDSKDRHEAELVESIAQHIHKKLIPKLPYCTENIVGIASRVNEVNWIMGMRLNDVRFIGVWGMGGIGKTTIARAVYEAIKVNFKVTCFLASIRERDETNGLVQVQKDLLSYLNINSCDFHDLYDGKKTIQNSLCNKKVLIVLDDVSESKQLENLAGSQDWFGPGSRVIITTRDMHLLRIHGVHKTYKVGGLVQNEALHLFCLKAFRQDQPQNGYLDLSKEVVEYTGGLPLALEVLGSYLNGRTIDVWHSALKQIRRFPLSKIQDTLNISYEGLNPMEKDLFLDIACFFKGMQKDKVINIVENCRNCARIGIEVLIERSLITVNKWGELEMHDLLKEMGRNIVFQESANNPGQQSRLWSQEDIDHVLTKSKGTKAIQSIVLNPTQQYEAHWSPKAFSETTELKFLKLSDVQLHSDLNCLPSSLKVLHWNGCSLKTLPLTNQLYEFVDIKLSHSKIEQLWHSKKFLEKLKYLDLSFSKNLKRSPDFSGVPNLEKLILEGCTRLTEVHPSLLHQKKLVIMDLKDCKSLKSLPGKLELSSLTKLLLTGCSKFKNVPEFGESMKHLSVLSLEGTAITKLPSSVGCLMGLADLNLKDCKNLVCLPDTIDRLKSLSILNTCGCSKFSSLTEGLKEKECSEELCPIESANKSKKLSFAWGKEPVSSSLRTKPTVIRLRSPGSVLSLHSLSIMNLSYCNLSEESILHISCDLPCLKFLDLSGNNFVRVPFNISKLTKLEYLGLNYCQKLQWLPELPSSIKELDASQCDSLQTSKFNPYSLFASLGQYPSEVLDPFDMVITGGEIPSWFDHQEDGGYVLVPGNFSSNELVGIALCFLLTSYAQSCHYAIECSAADHVFFKKRLLPQMKPGCPHLYILFFVDPLSCVEISQDVRFGLLVEEHFCTNNCLYPNLLDLKTVSCGFRLLYNRDMEDLKKKKSIEQLQ